MEGADIYRLIGMCLLVVFAWFAQVVGFSTFWREFSDGPPAMNVVDFDKDFSDEEMNRPLADLGYDLSVSFVSARVAEERIAEHQRRKRVGLLAGILGAIGVFFVAYKLWEDWIMGVACVFVGPLAIAWGMQRLNRSG